jgi:biotin carboxyl carrier protein
VKITIGGREFDVRPGTDRVTVDGKDYAVSVTWNDGVPIVSVDGLPFRVELPAERGPTMTVVVDHAPVEVTVAGATRARRPAQRPAAACTRAVPQAAAAGAVTASMTGEIVEIHVKPGDRVEEGTVLAILEAMKMRNEVVAPIAGTVERIAVGPGNRVNKGDVLVVLAEGNR